MDFYKERLSSQKYMMKLQRIDSDLYLNRIHRETSCQIAVSCATHHANIGNDGHGNAYICNNYGDFGTGYYDDYIGNNDNDNDGDDGFEECVTFDSQQSITICAHHMSKVTISELLHNDTIQ